MDSAVVHCWNIERARRQLSSQHLSEVTEAEWEWHDFHQKKRHYCRQILRNTRASADHKTWAEAEVERCRVGDMGVHSHMLPIGISM